jgi:hypothetical protein
MAIKSHWIRYLSQTRKLPFLSDNREWRKWGSFICDFNYRKDEDEDAVVAEVVLRDPGAVPELAQEVEPDEPVDQT